MTEETITLHGGPAHGRRFLWPSTSGDRLEFLSPTGDLSIPAASPGFRDIAREVRSIYIRSIVTPSAFVWQP